MDSPSSIKTRVMWIDNAKALGIFLIYLGHYGKNAGYAYPFVFSFHVQLFFFLSGCVAVYNQRSIRENILHKAKTLLIPFYTFGILSIIFDTIKTNSSENLRANLLILLRGATRNQFLSASLWFLTSLFCVELIFTFLKLVRNKWLMLAVSALTGLLQYRIFSIRFGYPSFWYNLDSAFRFLFFYVLGYCLMHCITILLKSEAASCRLLLLASGLIAFIYSSFLFFGKDILSIISGIHPWLDYILSLIRPSICIWLFILAAYFFQDNVLLQTIGQNTLYLCVSEYFIRQLASAIPALFGLHLTIETPVQAYLASVILILCAMHFLVPGEKKLMHMICNS